MAVDPHTTASGFGKQRGVALITALLIVSIATATAVSLASRQRVDIRQTANLLGRDRAWHISLGGESWVRHVLIQDAKEGKTDTLGDLWARKPPPIDVEGGKIWGRVTDLQGRFNLNNLVRGEQQDALAMGRFEQLLKLLQLPPQLGAAVADWIDKNGKISGADGAEDETYLSRDPPYPTANRPLISLTELRLIEGFDQETVRILSPFVTALPQRTAINVNTAPVEVIMSLHPEITHDDAETLEAARGTVGFESVKEFLAHSALKNHIRNEQGLTVQSNFFLATIRTRIGRGRVHLFTLFQRDDGGGVRTLLRSQGVF